MDETKQKKLLNEIRIQRYILRSIVNEYDPLGIGEGFPKDEYDDLISRIISIINSNKKDKNNLAKLLQIEIVNYSGLEVNNVEELIKSILNWWNFYITSFEKGIDLHGFEKCLSDSILGKALISGNEFGWKHEHINSLVEELKEKKIAILHGQFQYKLHAGTYDFYWLDVVLDDKRTEQSWRDYSKHTCDDFLIKYQDLYYKTNFDEEIKNFNYLVDKIQEDIKVHEYRCFVIYAITEEEYIKQNSITGDNL